MRVAGLMSGTSLDGIDVAIVDIEGRSREGALPQPALLGFGTVDYTPELRAALAAALPPHAGSVREVCALNVLVGRAFADALASIARVAGIELQTIDCVGSHGHTLYHLPVDDGKSPFAPSTLQIGDASTIAQRTGVTCVADFRAADIAAGGQGAPLVAFVDFALLRSATEFRTVVNIGGIANVTVLPPRCEASDVVAFDCGPGNMLIDACAALASDGKLTRDEGGRFAERGTVREELLAALLDDPYYRKPPPKTAGREQFGKHYAEEIWRHGRDAGANPDEIIATVTALTADVIARAIPERCDRVIVSGGGAHNLTLMRMLERSNSISLSDEFGLPVDAKEAIAFAILAAEAIRGRPGNLPAATGALKPVVLGKIAPGKNFRRLMTAIS